MKRVYKKYRDLGVRFQIKKPDGTIAHNYQKKQSVANYCAKIPQETLNKGVVVTIVYQKDVTNSATFYDLASLKKCMNDWTEPDLIQYCTGEGWETC